MWLVKECKDHGRFTDIYFSSIDVYDRFSRYDYRGEGLSNPNTQSLLGCPNDCGLCDRHLTGTLLGNIDLTNRCNLSCPICFATAEKSGYLYEPSIDQIRMMLQTLKNERPVPCFGIQFSGGEPTLRDDLPEIISLAYDIGFDYIQIATNGLVLARDKEYCRRLRQTVLASVYLQFDGVTPEPYHKTRGFDALPIKMKALGNMRETGINNVVLVPTVVKGVNDDQLGGIIDFAVRNGDIVRGVNFQPVSFTGRIDKSKLEEQRITIPDVLRLVEEQTDGAIEADDFYPVPSVVPLVNILKMWQGRNGLPPTCHPHCGAATYVFYDKGELVPITRIIDVKSFLGELDDIYRKSGQSKLSGLDIMRLIRAATLNVSKPSYLYRFFDVKKLLMAFLTGRWDDAVADFHSKALMIGTMHFQDSNNLDMDRLRRCGIHYATPDGRVIPFCSYNIFYRDEVQRRYAKKE